MAAADHLITGLKLVQLDSLIENVVEEAYKSLQNLTTNLKDQGDDTKKRALLSHLHATRQRLQRLDILLQWCHKAPAVAECKRVMEVAAAHSDAFRDAADQLAYLHAELINGKAPPYDVSTAFHVMRRRGYHALPTIIEDDLKRTTDVSMKDERGEVFRRMDFIVRCKLLNEGIPAGMRVVSIGEGVATLASSNGAYYQALVSLIPAPPEEVTLAKWDPQNSATLGDQEGEEVTKPAPEGETCDGTTPMETDVAGAGPAPADKRERGEAAYWRWRLMSFEILPGISAPLLSPRLMQWLQRNVEDRMWAAGDIQDLSMLGKTNMVVFPPPPLSKEERERRQRERDDQGRGILQPRPGAEAVGTDEISKASTGMSLHESHQPGEIPSWGESPLAALHVVLLNAASRLAVGMCLLEEARALETGEGTGWHVRIGKTAKGSGLRLHLWPQIPIMSFEDLKLDYNSGQDSKEAISLGDDLNRRRPFQTTSTSGDSLQGCVVDIVLDSHRGSGGDGGGGGIKCTIVPSYRYSVSGLTRAPVRLFDASGGISVALLLTEAATRCASLQLAGIRESLLGHDHDHDHSRGLPEALGPGWSVDYYVGECVGLSLGRGGGGGARTPPPPVLRLRVRDEIYALIHINLKTGAPVLALGHSILEDGAVVKAARAAVRWGQRELDARFDDVREGRLILASTGQHHSSKSVAWVSAIADIAAITWKKIAFGRRKAEIAGAAVPAGFSVTALPRILASDTDEVMVLRVPSFPPPTMLQLLSDDVEMGRRGSVVGLMLCDVTAASQQASRRSVGVKNWTMAMLCATPRGIPTSLLRRISLPIEQFKVSSGDGGKQKPTGGGGGGLGGGGARKRKAGDEDVLGDVALPSALDLLDSSASFDWRAILRFCQRTLALEQLRAQAELLGATVEMDSEAGQLTLSEIPELSRLTMRHATALQFGKRATLPDDGDVKAIRLRFRLNPESDPSEGAWITRADENMMPECFTAWEDRLVRAGAPRPRPEVEVTSFSGGCVGDDVAVNHQSGGLELRLSLAQGHSAVDALSICMGILHSQIFAAHLVAAFDHPSKTKALCPSAPSGASGCVSFGDLKLNSLMLKVCPMKSMVGKEGCVAEETLLPVTVTLRWEMKCPSQRKDSTESGMQSRSDTKESKKGAALRHVACVVTSTPDLPGWVLSTLQERANGVQEDEDYSERLSIFLEALAYIAIPAAVIQRRALSAEAQKAAGLMPGAVTVESTWCRPRTEPTRDDHDHNDTKGRTAVVDYGTIHRDYSAHVSILVRQLGRALQIGIWFARKEDSVVLLKAREVPPPLPTESATKVPLSHKTAEWSAWAAAAWTRMQAIVPCEDSAEDEHGRLVIAQMNIHELAATLPVLLEAVAGGQ